MKKLVFSSLTFTLAFLTALHLHGDTPPIALRIVSSGVDSEGSATFRLEWDAISNATYLVQSRTNLGSGDAWRTVDAVTPTNGAGVCVIKGRSIPENSVEFFQLVLPQPEIFSVEPAILAPGVAMDLYVIGQCFGLNDVLRINGVVQNNTVLLSSSLRSRPSFTAAVPGDYLVELLVAGQVRSSFHITCADGLSNPQAVLQGPPIEPLVSPQAAWLSKKGYDYYQARSDLASAGAQANPYFKDNSNQGDMPAGKISAYLSKKGYDYYQARVQEGKKGLNAVNVKLAFRGPGAGPDSPGDILGFNLQGRDNDQSFPTTDSLLDSQGGGSGSPGVIFGFNLQGRDNDQSLSSFGSNLQGRDNDPCVLTFSGEVQYQAVDLAVAGSGLDFTWGRTYSSRTGHRFNSSDRLSFSYEVGCVANGAGGMDVYDGTGRMDSYKLQTNGVYTCPELFNEGTLSNTVFRLTFADTGYWEFNPLDGSATAGTLARIVDHNSNVISLRYTGGLLTQIIDDLGRTNTIAHNADGRVSSVTDFSGRTVTYLYYALGEAGGSPGDLKSVISPPITGTPNGNDFPFGKTNTYTYSTGFANDAENHLLLSVIDANGAATYQHIYQHNQSDLEFLRCTSVQGGTNPPATFSYLPQTPTPSNQFATLRSVINDPVGNVTECFYDARNRCVKMQQFTGRSTPGAKVTATLNRPTGKLRASDPDIYECRAEWNNDSLCRKLYLFGGQQSQRLYQSDFDKSTRARKRADCRVVRELACCTGADTDGDGTADLTQREWHYDYDPRFGTACLRTGVIGEVVNGRPATAGRGPRQTTSLDGTYDPRSVKVITDRDSGRSKGFGFVISATDPRGNLTTGTYDANGNLVNLAQVTRKNGSITYADFDYKAHSRVAAITNAPDANGYRRVDRFDYYTNGPQAGYLSSIAIDESGVHLTTSFEYDARGNLTRCVDPRGNDWLCTWNALDQCVRVQTPTNLTARCATDFFYDANDNLVQSSTEVRDDADVKLGNRMVIRGFDKLHRLTRLACSVDATHFMTNDFVYDANGQCVLALGGEAVSGADPHQAISCQYDELGRFYRESSAPGGPDQSTTQYDYDLNSNLAVVRDGLEGAPLVTLLEYDGFAGFEACDALSWGGKNAMQGNTGQRLSRPTCPPYVRIGRGSCFVPRENIPAGFIRMLSSRRELSEASRLTTQAIQYSHASLRAPTKIIDPMGNEISLNYDACDNLKVIRAFGQTNDVPGTNGNIRLAECRFFYDELDRCVSSHAFFFDPATQAPIGDGARSTLYAYAPNGACLTVTDDLGRVTAFTYDTAGRPASVASPNNKTEFAILRDRGGNPTSFVQTDLPDLGGAPQVFAWTNVYDSLNRCVRTIDNVGNTNRCTYNSFGQVAHLYNPKEYTIEKSVDWLGRCTSVLQDLDGDGVLDGAHDVSFACVWSSSSDRLLSTTDSHGNTTRFGYDSLNRCTSITNADGTRLGLVWSPRSNLIQETDPNGTVIVHTYDLNDRCIANAITPGAGVASTTTFETFAYDGASRLVAATNDGSHAEFTYDSHGNCTRGTSGGLGALVTFDSLGNRLSLACPGGKSFTYAYDVLDQCTNILDAGSSLASFSYAGPGRVARVNYGNGARTQITYDGFVGAQNASGDFGQGQINSLTHATPIQGVLRKAASVDLQWDRNGNKSLRTDTIYAPAIPRTNDLILAYDPADRLTRATVLSGASLLRDTVYGLDQVGNRTNVTGSPICSGPYFMDALSPGPLDFQMNQYTTTPCDSRTYDENGNLVTRSAGPGSALSYAYDYAGRLVSVSDSGSPVASYTYDPLGRRISKTVYSGGLPPVTTQFVYDGDDVIEERSGGVLVFTFGSCRLLRAENLRAQAFADRIAADQKHKSPHGKYRDAVAKGVSRLAAFSGSGALQYYFHPDDQGNLLALTDPKANVLERYDYDDYGAVTFLTSDGVPSGANTSSVGNAYCWGGLRLDAETGLQNDDGGEYFDTRTGRTFTRVRARILNEHERKGGLGIAPGNNPWSGGSPAAMKPGTVKFFNNSKGFGLVTSPASSGYIYAMYSTQK